MAEPLRRFPGQGKPDASLFDAPTNLFYNGHRWYSPGWGRYTQADPIGVLRSGGIISNFHSYARSSPNMFIDIFGLDAVTSNPTVQLCFFCAVKKMGYGRNEREMGLWIVVGDWNDPFSYGCKTAGWTNSVRGKANYRGAFESSFVAHAHTHPTRYNGALRSGPAPGVNDIDMADQLQRDGYSYPVYTISPEGVWKYDPKTNQTTQELSANWTTPIKKCGKECEKMDQHGGIY